jgi:hypothetical protein
MPAVTYEIGAAYVALPLEDIGPAVLTLLARNNR